jgi:hypothetical protein
MEMDERPDFVSSECIVTGFARNNLSPEALAALDCQMQAWLDNMGRGLLYKIQITGMELVDSDGDTQDDVNQLHIHKKYNRNGDRPKRSTPTQRFQSAGI